VAGGRNSTHPISPIWQLTQRRKKKTTEKNGAITATKASLRRGEDHFECRGEHVARDAAEPLRQRSGRRLAEGRARCQDWLQDSPAIHGTKTLPPTAGIV